MKRRSLPAFLFLLPAILFLIAGLMPLLRDRPVNAIFVGLAGFWVIVAIIMTKASRASASKEAER